VTQQRLSSGVRVKVVDQQSPDYGRIAKLVSEAAEQGAGCWVVAFEYPLGGVAGRAVLREQQLQVIARL